MSALRLADTTQVPLWDYGWLQVRGFEILDPEVDALAALLEHTYYPDWLEEEGERTEVHGPFRRAALAPDDYEPISASDLRDRLREHREEEGFALPPEPEQWEAVEALVASVPSDGASCYRLAVDLDDEERRHVISHIFLLFHEYVVVEGEAGRVRQFILGYD